MKAVISPPAPFDRAAARTLSLVFVILLATIRPAPGADLRKAVQKVLPATVAVEWRASDQDDPSPKESAETLDRESPKHAFTPDALVAYLRAQKPDAVVLASGTAVSSDGLIVTATGQTADGSYSVTFHDGSTLPARLLVFDRRSGLQLLKVDSVKLPQLELAGEEGELGQQVVAVVCTDPKGRAVAQGIVAATDQRIPGLPCEVLQTDARVGKMSAGAPLADVDGRLLGIVTAIQAPSANEQGPAFAVPVEYVRLILEAREGREPVAMDRPMLGIRIDSPTEGGFPVVGGVFPDTPAAAAGIREGDEIAKIDGQDVSTIEDVLRRLGRHQPGDQVTVTIRRGGKQEDLKVTLDRFETPRTTTAHRDPKIEAIHSGGLYFVPSKDGTLRALTIDSLPRWRWLVTEDGKVTLKAMPEEKSPEDPHDAKKKPSQAREVEAHEEALKAYEKLLQDRGYQAPASATVRVQRSDVQQKLDQLGRDVQSLREQITALTEEVQKLGKQLQDKPTAKQ